MIIEHCKSGKSLGSFGAVIGKSKNTVYEWSVFRPDFAEACEIAKTYALDRWESVLIDQAEGRGGKSPAAAIFALTNFAPDQWKNRQASEVSGPEGGPIQITEIVRRIVDPAGNTDS
jgi:hypothetical protein